MNTDIGSWPEKISQSFRDFVVNNKRIKMAKKLTERGCAIVVQKKHYFVFAASCSHPKTTRAVSTVKMDFHLGNVES